VPPHGRRPGRPPPRGDARRAPWHPRKGRARASWRRSRPSWRWRARRAPAPRRTPPRRACPRPGRRTAGGWRRAPAARSARGSRPGGHEGSLFPSSHVPLHDRDKKGRGSKAAALGLEPCAHDRMSRRLPDVVIAVRRLCRQLLATSCRTSRGPVPIWNSPISRYKGDSLHQWDTRAFYPHAQLMTTGRRRGGAVKRNRATTIFRCALDSRWERFGLRSRSKMK